MTQWTYLRNRLTESRLGCQGEGGWRRVGVVGWLANVSYYIWNGSTTRSYCIAQGTIFGILWYIRASLVAKMVKNLPAVWETQFNPWVRKIPGEGNGNPLQYSCLGNSMDRGAWQAAVHGVAKSRTRLNDYTFTFIINHNGKEEDVCVCVCVCVCVYS